MAELRYSRRATVFTVSVTTIRRALAGLMLAVVFAAAATPAKAQTVWAVGDGTADANGSGVVNRIQSEGPFDRLLYLGDVYENGTAAEYRANYDPTYGRFKAITSPTPGNHEWNNRANGYDPYWGPGVRQPDGGHYYSFDLGSWHFVSLNSEEPIGPSSPQLAWLRADLARYPGTCTIAFVHRPRYSTGPQWNTYGLEPMWATLRGKAVAVLSGHTHNYQRHFPARDITQFVVGTGGRELGNTDNVDPRLAARADNTFGALRIRLGLGEAGYEFIPSAGPALDSGLLECRTHGPARAVPQIARPLNKVSYRAVKTLYGRGVNVRRQRLTILRRVGKRCSVYDGRRFLSSSCASKFSFPLIGRTSWKVKLRGKGLPPGAYRASVLARGLDETLSRRTVRFEVKKPRLRRPAQ